MMEQESLDNPESEDQQRPTGFIARVLNWIEWSGNKLPDPAVLFLFGLLGVWGASAIMSQMSFQEKLPNATEPIQIVNLLSFEKFAEFLSTMVSTFVEFHPLGLVLVALLGVGVAERSGFINACLKSLLQITPGRLLTPMLILVAIISHTAADAGYVLVIPIGGIMFYASGRHPLAGIAAAFAGVSGGFSASFIPSGLDPLLSSLTGEGAELIDPEYGVNPLCNLGFTAVSSIMIIGVGWFLTDVIIEPRLRATKVDGDPEQMPKMDELTGADKKGMWCGLASILIFAVLLFIWAYPSDSSLRDPLGKLDSYRNQQIKHGIELDTERDLPVISNVSGPAKKSGFKTGDLIQKIGTTDVNQRKQTLDILAELKKENPVVVHVQRGDSESALALVPKEIPGAPMMKAMVPIIFLFFVIPGVIHGYVSGTYQSHRDVIKGMSKTMETMGYYLVLVFFAALFIAAFKQSQIGSLLAVKGANFIRDSNAGGGMTIVGLIIVAGLVNLVVGSASAKWAMLAPIFVPMLMLLGHSPELTQAAYRVGDSTTNIITPMMPYFPLVVVFCQRYVTKSGIGTVGAMMLPFSFAFLACWTVLLLVYWQLGLPLGVDAPYTYSVPN